MYVTYYWPCYEENGVYSAEEWKTKVWINWNEKPFKTSHSEITSSTESAFTQFLFLLAVRDMIYGWSPLSINWDQKGAKKLSWEAWYDEERTVDVEMSENDLRKKNWFGRKGSFDWKKDGKKERRTERKEEERKKGTSSCDVVLIHLNPFYWMFYTLSNEYFSLTKDKGWRI